MSQCFHDFSSIAILVSAVLSNMKKDMKAKLSLNVVLINVRTSWFSDKIAAYSVVFLGRGVSLGRSPDDA